MSIINKTEINKCNPEIALANTSISLSILPPDVKFHPYKQEGFESHQNKSTGRRLENKGKWTFTDGEGMKRTLWGTDISKPISHIKDIGIEALKTIDLIYNSKQRRYEISINGQTYFPDKYPKAEWRNKPLQTWGNHEVASLGFRKILEEIAKIEPACGSLKLFENTKFINLEIDILADCIRKTCIGPQTLISEEARQAIRDCYKNTTGTYLDSNIDPFDYVE